VAGRRPLSSTLRLGMPDTTNRGDVERLSVSAVPGGGSNRYRHSPCSTNAPQ
jgi:hypothetical protein